ncbi:MAG: tRNA 2-thiouridine(34) synthase MnmA [Myxococcota bacterium]
MQAALRRLEPYRGRRVVVAMSGGVDSAVAAHLMAQAGAEVVGLAMRLHDPDPHNPLAPRACCPPDDLQDARRVAEHIGAPFYVMDARASFDRNVVRPFVDAYLKGTTPNPCVGCNAFVKLERLDKRARDLGAVALVTGHYARVEDGRLFAGYDGQKDQSYFLFSVPSEVLRSMVCPLGSLTKEQVRRLALEAGLPVAHKLESQEVCFVGGGGAGRFVMRQPEAQGSHDGEIVDEAGRVVGRHSGIMNFTIGQRRGIGVAARRKLHVLKLEPETRRVVVGEEGRLDCAGLTAERASWPSGVAPAERFRAVVQIRYRDPGTEALVVPLGSSQVEVRFHRPVRAIAPGQAVVFRRGEEVLGGAWITRSFEQVPSP